MRVLIVDDHPIVVSGCRVLLESDADIEVFEASDVETGYSAYFARMPDIVIVDLNLPGLWRKTAALAKAQSVAAFRSSRLLVVLSGAR